MQATFKCTKTHYVRDRTGTIMNTETGASSIDSSQDSEQPDWMQESNENWLLNCSQ